MAVDGRQLFTFSYNVYGSNVDPRKLRTLAQGVIVSRMRAVRRVSRAGPG